MKIDPIQLVAVPLLWLGALVALVCLVPVVIGLRFEDAYRKRKGLLPLP